MDNYKIEDIIIDEGGVHNFLLSDNKMIEKLALNFEDDEIDNYIYESQTCSFDVV